MLLLLNIGQHFANPLKVHLPQLLFLTDLIDNLQYCYCNYFSTNDSKRVIFKFPAVRVPVCCMWVGRRFCNRPLNSNVGPSSNRIVRNSSSSSSRTGASNLLWSISFLVTYFGYVFHVLEARLFFARSCFFTFLRQLMTDLVSCRSHTPTFSIVY